MDNKQIEAISTQNTLLSILIIVNLILVSIALYLFMRDEDVSPSNNNTEVVQNSIQSTKSEITVPAPRINPDKNATGTQQRPQTTADRALNNISQSLEDIGELTSVDAAYVDALKNLKKRVESQTDIDRPSINDATQHKAKLADNNKAAVDFFNKVDVSQQSSQNQDTPIGDPGLLAQIAQVVAEPEHPAAIEKPEPEKVKDNYLKTLKTESLERANEMRTVRVVEGDSLWDIAERAYGSGHEYPRIFKANPGLKDPDRIEVGMLLRVPL